MRFSEAIRKGAAIRPQARHTFTDVIEGVVCSCVLAAAYEGITGEVYPDRSDDAPLLKAAKPYRGFLRESAQHPVTFRLDDVRSIMESLNDFHGWTREQIADWVATLEGDDAKLVE